MTIKSAAAKKATNRFSWSIKIRSTPYDIRRNWKEKEICRFREMFWWEI